MVVTTRPAARRSGVTQATRGWPSTSTVQQPHWPCGLQPSFTERTPKRSRSASASEHPSSSTVADRPSTIREITVTGDATSPRGEDRLPRMIAGNAGAGRFSRRAFLLGSTGTGLLLVSAGTVACGSGGGADGGGSAKGASLAPFFATGTMEPPILRSGVEQRMPWGIVDEEGIPLTELPDRAETTITDAQGRQVGDTFVVDRHGDGTPFPYYPVRATMAEPGTYGVAIAYDGAALTGQVVFAAPEAIMLVQPGERAIPVVSRHRPTTAASSRSARESGVPPPRGHAERRARNGRPTALLISSPAYCQTNVCGPVLELLIEESTSRSMNLIHAEVYADAAQAGDVLKATLSETTTTYKLSFEPSLVVADAKGVVADRLDFVFDRGELRSALDGSREGDQGRGPRRRGRGGPAGSRDPAPQDQLRWTRFS